MATIKHTSSKNADYGSAECYLMFEHDEKTQKPVLDEHGSLIMRDDFRFDTVNCGPHDFAFACMRANLYYGKNNRRGDIKSHHYIISFDPRDREDHGLTLDKAQALGIRFCEEHFPGHQAIVAAHPDGHHHAGNIHVHIVINSLRIDDLLERKPYMDRACDTKAGAKHRCTGKLMRYLRTEVMKMCKRENLYQIDLLNGSKTRVTNREYHAARRGQEALDSQNARLQEQGVPAGKSKYETEKETLRRVIKEALEKAKDFDHFCRILSDEYSISVKESRGRFSYRTPSRQKPITSRMLGTDYSKEHILVVLEEKSKRRQEILDEYRRERHKALFENAFGAPAQKRAAVSVTSRNNTTAGARPRFERVVDIEAKKAEGKGAGYEYWAKGFNLKQQSKAYAFMTSHHIYNMEQLEAAIKEQRTAEYNARHAVIDMEKKIKNATDALQWIDRYHENHDICAKIKTIKSEKKRHQYRYAHEGDFIVYEAAVRQLKKYKIKLPPPDHYDFSGKIIDLETKKDELQEAWQEQKQLLKELQTARTNMQGLLTPARQQTQEQQYPQTPKRSSYDMEL